MDLINLSEDQEHTLEKLSTAKVFAMNLQTSINGLLEPTRVSRSPAKVMQTKTYRELEEEIAKSSGQMSADSGFGAVSGDEMEAMFGGMSPSPATVHGRNATHKTYAEIDATACLGDPYPKTPRRFRQPRSKSVTPPLFDLDAFDYYQYARPQAWTPLMQAQTPVRRPQTPVQDYQQCSRPQTPVRQQQTPVKQTPARATTPARTASPLLQQQTPIRAQSSPRLDYYESPSASACRPKSAPKSLLNLSPKTPVSYQSSTPYTPLSARRVLEMADVINFAEGEDEYQTAPMDACAASPETSGYVTSDEYTTAPAPDLDDTIAKEVAKMKKEIARQNARKLQEQQRLENEESLRTQTPNRLQRQKSDERQAFDGYWDSYYGC